MKRNETISIQTFNQKRNKNKTMGKWVHLKRAFSIVIFRFFPSVFVVLLFRNSCDLSICGAPFATFAKSQCKAITKFTANKIKYWKRLL